MSAALKWILVLLVLTEAGFMVLDGVRALAVGDYVTPKSGRYAGQLGPWSRIAEAVGIAPRSTLMKCIFVGYGGAWLVVLGFFLAGKPWTAWALLCFAVGSLWYLMGGDRHERAPDHRARDPAVAVGRTWGLQCGPPAR